MTDSTRGTGVPSGPPWSVDVLADLHAGALDARQSAALWARVGNDPEAQAILAALDSVRHDLDALGDAPAEPMPAHFAARLDNAIAAEAARSMPAAARPGVAPVTDMAQARSRRNRRMGWMGGLVAAAAAVVAVAFVALPGEQPTGGTAQPEDGGTSQEAPDGEAPNDAPPLALKADDLGPAINGLTGQEDYGPLEDEQGLADCLSSKGIENPSVIGAREVTIDGTAGVAALLAGGTGEKRFRLVIVAPDCEGDLITDTSLG
ncbi:anti-sigma factor family protein [Actinophytocola glycyrrhizae]|uniref:Anti-sigma factor family protein n=1 Tax=Actinophytocola glycyrrhizae TaxID=2044873 RepID=A0ABV9S395_9PSEU